MGSTTELPTFLTGGNDVSASFSNQQRNSARCQASLPSVVSPGYPSGINARRRAARVTTILSFGIVFLYMVRLNIPIAMLAMTDVDYADSDAEEFAWDELTQGLIFSAFFWGYVPAQIITGLIIHRQNRPPGTSDCFWVAFSTFTCGIAALVVPKAAYFGGWVILCIAKAFMGLCQGVALPFIQRIIVGVLPGNQRPDVGSLVFVEALFAAAATPYISSILIPTSLGWPLVFYSSGLIAVVWSFVEIFSLGGENLSKISASRNFWGSNTRQGPAPILWRGILRCSGFWALVVTNVAQTWCFWLLITRIPLYLKSVLGFDLVTNARMIGLAYLVGVCVVLVTIFLSQGSKRSDSDCFIQNIFNSVSFWTPAVAPALIGAMPDGDTRLCFFLLLVAIASNTLSILGYRKNAGYLSEKFAYTINGISNVTANLIAISSPIVAALLVPDPTSPYQWGILFYLTSAVYFVGNLVFLIFGSGVKQEWDNSASLRPVPPHIQTGKYA